MTPWTSAAHGTLYAARCATAIRASEVAAVIARLRALFANKEPVAELVDLNEATEEVIGLSRAEFRKSNGPVRPNMPTICRRSPPIVSSCSRLC